MSQSSRKSNDEPPTQSDGEAGLPLAIELLKPFPWKPVKRAQYSFEYPELYPVCSGYDEAEELCDDIAGRYAAALKLESQSIRLSVMRNQLSDMVRSCRSLSRQISGLSEESLSFIRGELYFSRSKSTIVPEDDLEDGLRGWPLWYRSKPIKHVADSLAFGDEEKIDDSMLVKTLVGLADHSEHLLRVSKSDYRLAERKDRGGKNSVFTLLHCSPRWLVVRECWTLFLSSSHLQPSTFSDGKLEQFIGAIHEHATGKRLKTSLIASLKEYRRVVMTMSSAQKALLALFRKNGVRTKEDIEDHWDLGHIELMFRDSDHWERGMALYDKFRIARLTLEFGPQLVGLQTKSPVQLKS